MDILKSFYIALSTYSIIPVPQCEWNDRSLSFSFCFLPCVGVVIGATLAAWLALCWQCGIGILLRSAVCVFIPIAITGGIHLDGFCDTVDALCSHQEREKCLRIMKDPNSGAFAVIYLAAYLLLELGLMSETSGKTGVFCLIFVLSRAISVLSVTGQKNARGEGMLASFQAPAHRRYVRAAAWAWLGTGALLMDLSDLFAGSGALLGAIAAWGSYHAVCRRRFGGITGDTSGFFVQLLELFMLIGMEAGQCCEIAKTVLSRSF